MHIANGWQMQEFQKTLGIFRNTTSYCFATDSLSMSTLREQLGASLKSRNLQNPITDIVEIDSVRQITEIIKPVQTEKAKSPISDSARMLVSDITEIVYSEGENWPSDPPSAHFSRALQISNIAEPSIPPKDGTKYRNRTISKTASVVCDIAAQLPDYKGNQFRAWKRALTSAPRPIVRWKRLNAASLPFSGCLSFHIL